jgi:hypothetical protein
MGYKIPEIIVYTGCSKGNYACLLWCRQQANGGGEDAAKPEFLKKTSEVPVYFLFNGLAVYCETKTHETCYERKVLLYRQPLLVKRYKIC